MVLYQKYCKSTKKIIIIKTYFLSTNCLLKKTLQCLSISVIPGPIPMFIDHLYLYQFSALKWRKVIGAGEVSGHLYFTVQPAYFWRGKVSKTRLTIHLLHSFFAPLHYIKALLLSSCIEDDVNKNKNVRLA